MQGMDLHAKPGVAGPQGPTRYEAPFSEVRDSLAGLEPPRGAGHGGVHGIGHLGQADTSAEDARRRKQDEMKRILEKQVEEKRKEKEMAAQKKTRGGRERGRASSS